MSVKRARIPSVSDPIGVFDSGVGGLTILRALREALPEEHLVYVADSAHMPYGQKAAKLIRARAVAITSFLAERRAKAVVVACNTATAAAIDFLRAKFRLPFVGVEPAVKPASAATCSGVVGVLATPGTLDSERFGGLVERFADGVRVLVQPCDGLAERIERGAIDDAETQSQLRRFVGPLLAAGADVIALGCTHYPLIAPQLRRIVGPEVAIIETGPAVARQLGRLLEEHGLRNREGRGGETFWVSGSLTAFERTLARIWAKDARARRLPAVADAGLAS